MPGTVSESQGFRLLEHSSRCNSSETRRAEPGSFEWVRLRGL